MIGMRKPVHRKHDFFIAIYMQCMHTVHCSYIQPHLQSYIITIKFVQMSTCKTLTYSNEFHSIQVTYSLVITILPEAEIVQTEMINGSHSHNL